VGSSKVTGPPQAFHYKLRNPLTILGYFTWCRRWRRNTTGGTQGACEKSARASDEGQKSTSLLAHVPTVQQSVLHPAALSRSVAAVSSLL
jgi:hypothetical protein